MPGQANVYSTETVVASPPDDTQTIIATLDGVAVDANYNRVRVEATVCIAPGTDATAVALQWYRGAIADGVLVGNEWASDFPAAGETGILAACGIDDPPAGVYTYNLAAIVTGATAASTIEAVLCTAIVGG